MTPENFRYWLQGFVELNDGKMPTPEQWKSICDHLRLTFEKVTPPVSAGTTIPWPWDSGVTLC